MASDTNLMPGDARKRSFYVEEEEIVVKPSTELIPDEYEPYSNEAVSIHIFRNNDQYERDIAKHLLSTFQEIGHESNEETNLHELSNQKCLMEDLACIKENSLNKSALILVFVGYFEYDGCLLLMDENDSFINVHIKTVWNTFSANNCHSLKDKPKIFIFCTSRCNAGLQSDSSQPGTIDSDKVYDLPAESDILIVYKKIDDFDVDSKMKRDFFSQLCNNLSRYSKKHDVIDLIGHMHNMNQRFSPLIISSLTRKFYLTPFNDREHYLSIVENNAKIDDNLKKIKEDVRKLHDIQAKKKEKKFFNFSFKTSSASSSSGSTSRSEKVSSSGSQEKPIWRI